MATDLSQFVGTGAGKYPQSVIDAVQALFAAKPDREAYFTQNFGGDLKGFLDGETGWWSANVAQQTANIDQFDPEMQVFGALADAGDANATSILTKAGYQNVPDTTSMPLEQGLLQTVLPGLMNDITKDTGRQGISDALTSSVLQGADSANAQLARTQGSGNYDTQAYLKANPDVTQFAQWALSDDQGAKDFAAANGIKTADDAALYHYNKYGKSEGRPITFTQSQQLQSDFANADQTTAANIAASNQATQTQLGALATATQAMQQNLTGNLAEKAAALQTQVASLYQNLDQLDATQKAALTQQIATQQQDLEESIATQRQALETQIAALKGAADAQSQAKVAALQTEVQALTAAQAPVAAARTAAADLQATAINVGLERTKDQLTAQNAQAGFVGGSTGQDAALARATIGARQSAAQAMGAADLSNATDTRDIGVRGATGQRTIADALADAQAGITAQGATGNANLTNALATQRQALGDAGATGLAGIINNTATSRAGIGAYGANTGYTNATTGADQGRTLADALASGTYSLTSNNAANILAANQQGNAAKATYYDNDYSRSLAAAMAPASIAGNTATALTALDNYGRSGVNNTLNTLNWWNTNTTAAPTAGALATTADTTGNSISNLGAGLLGAGTNALIGVGNQNAWWAPKTTTPTAGSYTPATSPTGYVTPGGNAGVSTNWGFG